MRHAATLTDSDQFLTLPALAARLALTPGAVRHAMQRKQYDRVPPPDALNPYRWKVATVVAFLARPAPRQASTRGYRPGSKQRRMFDRIGTPLAIVGK